MRNIGVWQAEKVNYTKDAMGRSRGFIAFKGHENVRCEWSELYTRDER